MVVFLLLAQKSLMAQVGKPKYPDSLFATYYHQRLSLFQSLPQTKGDIIFVGNSITDGGEWNELFDDKRIKNRGISADITAGVIHRLDEIVNRKPAKVFLMIGTNDLARNIPEDSVVKNILIIADYLRQQTPATKLFIQSILPVNDVYGKFAGHTNKANQINKVNARLKSKAAEKKYTYIDLSTPFSDPSGKLKAELSNDGLHLKGEAYLLWKHLIYPYVYDLQAKPAIIPLPQSLTWNKGHFSLYASKTIVIKDEALRKEAVALQQYLRQKGVEVTISKNLKNLKKGEPFIELQLDKNFKSPQYTAEAYRLTVEPGKINIQAKTAHGIFYGVQTLQQLIRDGVMVNACDIVDWPAFSWRAYMVDVGRNYQSMASLKKQIDVMAKYKLNVFHFHPTEDVAWRIAIKQYPELTAPEHMTRNKGMYYTESDMKELIAYCKERYIMFVPEIDMPGHSQAFKRAMKTDMQSDSGLAIVKNILSEVIETYDFPYIHIGADEVKITNKNFVPEVTAHIQRLGKKVIGWEPGGNFTANTIRQMWMEDNKSISSNAAIQYIDSRHLYINHMDPLEAVVTIFNRRISNKVKGDDNAIGATLCVWHDRAVSKEEDIETMNPVYPGILTFAERIWRGGGKEGWVADIGEPNTERSNEFIEFENRLLDQKKQNFSNESFPYQQQSTVTWKLYGPYENRGDLKNKFAPETSDIKQLKASKEVVGGTIVWRHWWAPLISSVLDSPKENTTWYAASRIWSDEDKVQDFWIGFNNLSRSMATNSPMPGTWDNHQSKVWVNGTVIDPPTWKRGGQTGHPEIPLADEGYEYREPTKIRLKKGWNDVLIKSPIASFKGKNWQNPEKWMFTFVAAE
ncbi:family 20 glycosylhydrolase [Pedobacter immunditicola]|uniref:family 20 glycosylhydrolase n=1 Tax=Pedobacter immunditicola TaxID=3133440 RepID=UPI0030A5F722